MNKWYDSYIGFPYKHLGHDTRTGIDCFNLCKLVFKQELNIDIPYSTYDFCNIADEDWYNKTHEQWMLKATDNGDWVEITNLNPFDIILMSIGSTNVVNHCALYLGEGLILQTMENRDSGVYKYHRYYQQYTVKKVRWKNLINLKKI